MFNNIFEFYKTNDIILQKTFTYYIITVIVFIVLQIFNFAVLKSRYLKISFLTKKVLNNTEDIKNIRKGILYRAVMKYISIASKGVVANAEIIAEGEMSGIKILFFNLDKLIKFYSGIEFIAVIFGVMFWFSFEYNSIWILSSAISFILLKLTELFFSVSYVRNAMKYKIIDYLQNEIGKFYANDLSSVINGLKFEVKNLESAVAAFREGNTDNAILINAIREQFNYIENNQDLLKDSLNSYEISLEEITSRLGEALSSIVEFQIQKTYSNLSETVSEDINKFNLIRNDIATKIDMVIDKLNS